MLPGILALLAPSPVAHVRPPHLAWPAFMPVMRATASPQALQVWAVVQVRPPARVRRAEERAGAAPLRHARLLLLRTLWGLQVWRILQVPPPLPVRPADCAGQPLIESLQALLTSFLVTLQIAAFSFCPLTPFSTHLWYPLWPG